MKINKQSNIYTAIYVTVLVAIVGTGLAFVSMGLRGKQQANEDADKMSQILQAVRITAAGKEIAPEFNRVITRQFVVNVEGDSIGADAFDVDVAHQNTVSLDKRLLPVYVAAIDGATKYVIPVRGNGLWGPIWGYVAFNADGSTVYGAYFAHESETPGLGAEIEKPAFRQQFYGKQLFKGMEFLPINVLKVGTKPQKGEDYVDAVSGGTITSKGVAEMLDSGLRPYEKFLSKMSKSNNQQEDGREDK